MKQSIRISVLLAIAALVFSCGGKHTGQNSIWPPASPLTDSLSALLDSMTIRHASPEKIFPLIARLEQGARAEGAPEGEVAGRAAYFRAYATRIAGNPAEGDSMAQAAMEQIDSARYPYVYNRLDYLADNSTELNITAYDRICRRLAFFEKQGDPLMTAIHYTSLGNLLKNIRDPQPAISAYRIADSLYTAAGYPDISMFNKLNLSSALAINHDTIHAVEILRQMTDDPIVKARPDVEALVVDHLYNLTDDPALPSRLAELEAPDPSSRTLTALSRTSLNAGKPAEALSYAKTAIDKGYEEGDGDAVAWALFAAGHACAALGDWQAAYSNLKDAQDLTDMICIINEPDQIKDAETLRTIEARRMEAQLNAQRRTLHLVCVAFALFVVAAAAAWITNVRMRRLERQRTHAASERDRVARKLLATQAVMDESEKLISDVEKNIGELAGSGNIPASESRKIASAIKNHASMQGDRETFIETFMATHPHFASRLLLINEAITEPDIRLASYIATGLDTKRIAATMGIRPESVKQARWRLRTKLGLEKGESLEAALRNLLK